MTRQPHGPLPFPPLTPAWGGNSAGARQRESADGIERGPGPLLEERFENTAYGRETVARRARAARQRALENVNPWAERPRPSRGRSR